MKKKLNANMTQNGLKNNMKFDGKIESAKKSKYLSELGIALMSKHNL